MKAIKGCTNPECKECKKRIHFKEDDEFCSKCGNPLSFVCADCWKAMDNNSERLCMSCKALRDDKRDKAIENAKNGGKLLLAGAATLAGVAGSLSKDVVKIADAYNRVARIIKK